ncbi:alpha/beta hydrolase [Streptomyces sioyaensis]|uniref:alpha/beta hydrolase n=1 Tax=Streptomyces sioyaensis TaxID=67364 RepID=UPI00365123DA
MAGKPSIVFAHGLWADGSCFNKLIPTLQAEGHEVFASQHGLDSLESDVACVNFTLNHVPGPIVLVGHSYGGTLITKAGTHDRVGALVYIAALAPHEDETSQEHQDKFPRTPIFEHVDVTDGRVWLKPSGVPHFCGDLPEAEQKLVLATGAVPVADLFNQQVPGTAWRTKPSWFIVASNDRTVHPDLERSAAERMGANVRTVDSSHVPMLSHPDFVLDVIREAAESLDV